MMVRQFRDDLADYERVDITRLKAAIPELALLPDLVVASLYRTYSEDSCCANWLALADSADATRDFERWLFGDSSQAV